MVMGKRLVLSEEDYKDIRGLYKLNEQEQESQEEKMFCNKSNTKSIHDIIGSDDLRITLRVSNFVRMVYMD